MLHDRNEFLQARYESVCLMSRNLVLLFLLSFPMMVSAQSHLVPIAPFSAYQQDVYKTLIGDELPSFGLIQKPSFAPESAVYGYIKPLFDESGEPKYLEDGALDAEAWYLEAAIVNRNISYAKYAGSETRTNSVSVKRQRVEVSRETYSRLLRALYLALRETRYSDEPNCTLDGTSYMFFSSGRFGESRGSIPEKTNQHSLAALYEYLFEYIESGGQEDASLDGAMKLVGELENGIHNKQLQPTAECGG